MDLKNQIDTSRKQSVAGLDVPWLLRQRAERTPDKVCLIWKPFEGAMLRARLEPIGPSRNPVEA